MAYTLPQFLDLFFDYCDQNKIDYCFARNYQDLPDGKTRGDLDIVITPEKHHAIIRWVEQTPDLTLVNKIIQKDVVNLFIAGVHWGNGFQAIQMDLLSSLTWKGIPFLPIENILLRGKPLSQEKKRIKKADAVDQMVMSFFSKVINAGIIKEKDWTKWRALCAKKPQAIRDKFKRRIGEFYSNALIDHIERDDQAGVLKNVNRWRFGFIQHQWHQEGMHLIVWFARHLWAELKTIFRLKKTSRLLFFGVDGAGKTTLLNAVKETLPHLSKRVDIYHVRPPFWGKTQDNPKAVLKDPQAKPLRNKVTSTLKQFYFLGAYWLDAIKIRRQPTIQIYDRYFHDMLVDPKRYRFGGSEKCLRFVLKLIPKPDLAVLVDIAPEIAQSRKAEVTNQETTRQCRAYRDMVIHAFKNHLIVSGETDIVPTAQKIHDQFITRLGQKNRGK